MNLIGSSVSVCRIVCISPALNEYLAHAKDHGQRPIHSAQTLIVREKQLTGTGAIKRQIPLLIPKREINKYYK